MTMIDAEEKTSLRSEHAVFVTKKAKTDLEVNDRT